MSEKNYKAKRDIYFYKKILFISKGLILEAAEIELISKWNIVEVSEKIENANYFDEVAPDQAADAKASDKVEVKDGSKAVAINNINLVEYVVNFIKNNHTEIISKSKKFSLPKIEEFCNSISLEAAKDNDKAVLHSNIFSTKDKIINITSKMSIYIALICQRLDLKKETIMLLLKANLLLEIYYINHPMKFGHSNIKPLQLNFKFLDEHIKKGYIKIKEMLHVPEDIAKLVVLHHEHIDGSGILGLEKSKIPSIANILCVVQEFFYLSSGILENYFPPLSLHQSILVILKNREKFFPEILKAFLSLNPFYPLGEIIEIENLERSKKHLGMVVKANQNYRLPSVQLVERNKVIEGGEVLDLSKEQNYKIIGHLKNAEQRKAILSNFAERNSIIFE